MFFSKSAGGFESSVGTLVDIDDSILPRAALWPLYVTAITLVMGWEDSYDSYVTVMRPCYETPGMTVMSEL